MGRRNLPEPGTPVELGAALDAVLRATDSPSARDLRVDLADVVARLVRRQHDGTVDGEGHDVREVVSAFEWALRRHLGPSAADADVPAEDAVAIAPVAEPRTLRHLAAEVRRDEHCAPFLTLHPPPDDPTELWEWLHLQFLRLPAGPGAAWRKHASALAGTVDDDRIVPACPSLDHPGWDGDPDVTTLVFNRLGDARTHFEGLAVLVVRMLSVLQRSADLVSGHSGWAREYVQPLAEDETRHAYEEMVLDTVGALTTVLTTALTTAQTTARMPPFDTVVGVDESIRSLFPYPLPAPDSWWAGLGRQSAAIMDTYARAYGAELTVLDPGQVTNDQRLARLLDVGGKVRLRVPRGQGGMYLWQLRLGYGMKAPGQSVVKGARVLVGEAE